MAKLFSFYLDYYVEDNKIFSYEDDRFIRDNISVSELNISYNLIQKLKLKQLCNLSNLLEVGYACLNSIGFNDEEIEELYIAVKEIFDEIDENDMFLLDDEESNSDSLDADNKYELKKDANINFNIDTENTNFSKDEIIDKIIKHKYFYIKDGLIISKNNAYFIKDLLIDNLLLSATAKNKIKVDLVNNFYLSNILKSNILENNSYSAHINQKIQKSLYDYFENNIAEYDDTVILDVCKNRILFKLNETKFEGMDKTFLIDEMQVSYDVDIIMVAIEQLIAEKKIFPYLDNKLFYKYESFPSYIYKIEDSKLKDILYSRLDGLTLEEIATKYNITRERIRQIIARYMKKTKSIIFREDRFKYLFENYNFSCEEFSKIFNEKERTYYYLNSNYNKGEKDIYDAIEDETVPTRLRNCIFKYQNRNNVYINGRYIKKSTRDLLTYYISEYCIEPKRIEELFNDFNLFVSQFGENLQVESARAFEGMVNRLDVICSIRKMVRYYPFSQYDFDYLFNELELESYNNIEISTDLLMKHNQKVLEEYDIRDMYELHNLLRKVYVRDYVNYSRMPFIVFGNYNRKKYLLSILHEFGELSPNEFIKILEERNGYSTQIVFWLQEISEYHVSGKYLDSNTRRLSDEECNLLSNLITADFYLKDEIDEILKNNNINMDDISLLDYKKIGYRYSTNYIIKSDITFSSYIRKKLLEKDIFNINDYKKFINVSLGYQIFDSLRKDYEIIEFEKDNYLNIRKLKKIGISKSDLFDYVENVSSFMNDEDFTVKNIRKTGFSHKLDDLGFEDIFYESILKNSNTFKFNNIFGVCIFNNNHDVTRLDFIVNLINKYEIIEKNKLNELVSDEYGMAIDFHTLNNMILNTNIYYNPIMSTYYKDYDTFLKEI